MDQQQQAPLRRIGRQILWTVGAVVVVSAVVFVINYFFVHQPLWDWLELLIVPVVLAGGGLWFNAQQREREQQIADERAQDEALQAYLDPMSQLLTDEARPLHRASVGDYLSMEARARTLTVLPRLDGARKARVVQFLYESGLITTGKSVFPLVGADLRNAKLMGARLIEVAFRGADLRGANLANAELVGADLRGATLRGADLRSSWLEDAYLGVAPPSADEFGAAKLSGRHFGSYSLEGADLSGANMSGTRMSKADLRRTKLSGADLSKAELNDAKLDGAEGITADELARQASSLEGATMPNGQKYEDWLKDREDR